MQFHHLLPRDEANCVIGFTPSLVNLGIKAHKIFCFCWLRHIVDGAKNKLVLMDCLFWKGFFSLGPGVQAINVAVVDPGDVSCTAVNFHAVSIV